MPLMETPLNDTACCRKHLPDRRCAPLLCLRYPSTKP